MTQTEHVRSIRHKDIGGRAWRNVDDTSQELDPWQFHLATKKYLNKTCQEPELKAKFRGLSPDEYIPFGYQKDGKKIFNLQELLDASRNREERWASNMDWHAVAEQRAVSPVSGCDGSLDIFGNCVSSSFGGSSTGAISSSRGRNLQEDEDEKKAERRR